MELIHFNYSPHDFTEICKQFNDDDRVKGIIVNNSITILRTPDSQLLIENGILTFGEDYTMGYISLDAIYSIKIF